MDGLRRRPLAQLHSLVRLRKIRGRKAIKLRTQEQIDRPQPCDLISSVAGREEAGHLVHHGEE